MAVAEKDGVDDEYAAEDGEGITTESEESDDPDYDPANKKLNKVQFYDPYIYKVPYLSMISHEW